MTDKQKNALILVLSILFVVAAIGFFIKANQTPVVIQDDKVKYLEEELEKVSMDRDVAINEVLKYKELEKVKPKEMTIIKTKYVKISDSLISLPLTDKAEFLAVRIHPKR